MTGQEYRYFRDSWRTLFKWIPELALIARGETHGILSSHTACVLSAGFGKPSERSASSWDLYFGVTLVFIVLFISHLRGFFWITTFLPWISSKFVSSFSTGWQSLTQNVYGQKWFRYLSQIWEYLTIHSDWGSWRQDPNISIRSFIYLFSCACGCFALTYVCTWCLQRPEEGFRSPGTGATDGLKCLMGAGTWTQVLLKSNWCS